MTYPPLLYPTDLNGLPGAPFSDEVTAAAAERVRDECGWHIAPVVTETVEVSVKESGVIVLPTRRLVNVTAIRDVTDTTPVALTLSDWRWKANGVMKCSAWSRGCRDLEVDISHGYDTCPSGLLGRAADLARRSGRGSDVRSEQVGSVAYSYAGSGGDDAALSKYALPVIA